MTDKTASQAMITERPVSPEEMARRIRDWRTAVLPFVDLAAGVYARAVPTYILTADGKITQSHDGLTSIQREHLRFIDDQIVAMAKAYGVPLEQKK